MLEPSYLNVAEGISLAYHKIDGRSPYIVFCHGFRSEMKGDKATALAAYCKEQGLGFLAFDHFGHGMSSGKFIDGTIGRWREDALAIIDALVDGSAILVGSSMGGWISVLTAIARPEKICGFIGIAAAPDFTENLMVKNLSQEHRTSLQEEGYFLRPSAYGEPYPITLKLLEEAKSHLVLNAPIALRIPVHLLHGMRDVDVPWQISTELAERITGQEVRVTLQKMGDHRLATPSDIEFLCQSVDEMVKAVRG